MQTKRTGPLWAITSYFNPFGYRRRLQNYRTFRDHLSAPLLTVELSLGTAFELSEGDADHLIQIRGGDVMFQKERLLNMALAAAPRECRAIAWVDADVLFGAEDWSERALAALERSPLVHLYEWQHNLPPGAGRHPHDWNQPPATRSVVSRVADSEMTAADFREAAAPVEGTAWGLAWAARRELLDDHGFYDACILGSGDVAIYCGAIGGFERPKEAMRMHERRYRHYLEWARPFHAAVRGSVDWIRAPIFHLWHGDEQNRKYRERHQGMARFQFDPATDISITEQGCWRWSSEENRNSTATLKNTSDRGTKTATSAESLQQFGTIQPMGRNRASLPRLAMSLLVRDEAHLIRHNVEFHHRLGVDCFVITDNGSDDGTREIIEELSASYPIRLIDEPMHTMNQDHWVTRMARVAACELDADWIVNSDADEFWYPSSGSLKTEISSSTGVLLCNRSNMLADRETLESPDYVFYKSILRVARPFTDHRPFVDRPWELSKWPVTMTKPLGKVMCRLDGLVRVGYGNHDAEHEGPLCVSSGIHVYHYPVRTFAEFCRKVENHGSSLRNNPALPRCNGWHVRRWDVLRKQGLLEQEYERLALDRAQVEEYLRAGTLATDRTIWEAVASDSVPVS